MFPPLPIDEALPRLGAALDTGPHAVLVAPPGAGKTTRVPLALLDAPWRRDGRIILLEPRRLAARAAARRMATTLGEEVGGTVGLRVRLETRVSAATRIEVVTEGVFTRMILDDPELAGVATVVFDEFHERSLDADLGLALALDAAALRPDLRLLAMSATIDGARVARLMGEAPVVTSEGRAFPVETRYSDRDPMRRLEDEVATLVVEAMRQEPGSALVFLPGEAEIRRTEERLTSRLPADVDVAPLYGQLPAAAQDRAIAPPPLGRRKVVLSTSIAETSLTIEGVRIVVDSGYRRSPAYDPATGLSALVTRRVSRAGADQRRGRAGRVEPGICWRLWSEGQTGALEPFDRPEILDADLTGLALDLASWGVGDPARLAFLDPPPKAAYAEAQSLLRDLEAIDADGRITAEGRALARLPLHPRLAHMIHRAAAEGAARDAAELAALLGERGLGGDDIDLASRLSRFRSERGPRADAARAMARSWAALVGGRRGEGPAPELGCHLARAFPDRVAERTGPGRFRLRNGRGATLDEGEALAAAPYLVVAVATGSAAGGRIRSAVAIDRAAIEDLFAAAIEAETELAFDPTSRSVRARNRRRLGALRLADEPAAIDDHEAAARLLAEGAARIGIAALPWSKEQRALCARAAFMRAADPAWPDLSDAGLAADAEWLAPHLTGRTGIAEITPDDLGRALDAVLPYARRAELERLLPSHFEAPSGSRLPIDYDAENGPALAIRVQELFGLDRHPAVAGGRLPLLLVLLSPAHRPIQTTRDLPGFWRGSWRDVARDLKGRYPKHHWPDDPLAAAATDRAKPRVK